MANRMKNVNGIEVELTDAEEAERDAEEKAWADGACDRAIQDLRQRRNSLLSATDFHALSDNTMSDEMKKYRQDLRDITVGLTTEKKVKAKKFPTKP